MRRKLIAANWKMNKTHEEVKEFISNFEYTEATLNQNVEVLICPSYVFLQELNKFYHEKGVFIGSQNLSDRDSGALTGEISASMLHSMKVGYSIIGHSERRKYFFEDNEKLTKKVDLAIQYNIVPIFCCGEQLEQRQGEKHFAVVEDQIRSALFHLDKDLITKVVIAYEPVWAIGTGVNATPYQAQEMHAFIRDLVRLEYDDNIAQNILILYGGSCNSSNAAELFSCADVDGGLVGGASLDPVEFLKIIKAANE